MRAAVLAALTLVLWGCGSSGGGLADNDGGVGLSSCTGPEDCTDDWICSGGRCAPANCEDFRINGNETDLDCGGDCAPCTEGQLCLSAFDCSSQFCDQDGSCRDCQSDDDCLGAPNTSCAAGTCVLRRGLGETCDDDAQCTTGFCVDGRCCDGPCDGQCESCNASGTCVLVTAGDDPRGDCPDDGACGRNGACDGSGGCQLYASGTACNLNTCAGGQNGAGLCNGAGICASTGGESCDPYVCGPSDVCLTSCGSDTDCVSGYYCSGGACALKQGQGSSCSIGNQCLSGFCADGVCCNSACGGTCRSCSGAQNGGNNGVCSNIPANTDPGNECTAQAASTCGQTGMCSGSGTCALHPSGTVCVGATCSNNQALSSRTCNGSGTCQAASVSSCSPYVCSTSSCRTSCSSNSHCQAGYYCNGSSCVALKAPGQSCTAGSQCQLGSCNDGVCCDWLVPPPDSYSCPEDVCWACAPGTGACSYDLVACPINF